MTFFYNGREQEIPEVKCWYPQTIVYDPIKAGSIDGTDIEPHDAGIVRALNSRYKPSYKAKGNPLRTIFVSRLSLKTTEKDLKTVFCRYGKIVFLRLVRDIVTGLSKRYAFIEYETSKMALNAYLRCHSIVINNSEVFVDFECGRLLPGWKPRRLGGGFGGEKHSGQLRFGGRVRSFRSPLNLVAFRQNRGRDDENQKTTVVSSSTPISSTITTTTTTSNSNSMYFSTASTPSTISLPLTPPPLHPTIVLPLTPPSHSNIHLPLTPPSNQIIVLPLTPPSQTFINLPLTPPSNYIPPLPLTPPSNWNAL